MAIIMTGGGVAGIRGSAGGLTFSANTNGPFVKHWARPRNPNTYRQAFQRYYYQQWPAAWRALTGTQRSDWNDYASAHPLTNALGQAYYRSGYQWFTSCNQNLIVCEGTPIADAPLTEQPDTIDCNSLEYDDTDAPYACNVLFDDDAFADVFIVVKSVVIPYSANMSYPSNYALFRSAFDPGPGVTQLSCWAQHSALYGSPAEGYKWFAHVHTMNTDGLRSNPWAASIEYTP